MIIRHLDNKDLREYKEAILELLIESYQVNFNLSHEQSSSISKDKITLLKDYIAENNTYVIGVFSESYLIAFLWLYIYKYQDEKRIHINQIIVSKENRGQGIAKRLMNEAEKIAFNNDINIIDLNVSEQNVDALRMYEKLGFSTDRRLMSKLI